MAVRYTTWAPPWAFGFAAKCQAKDTDYSRLLDLLQASPVASSWDVLINRYGQWMPYEASELVDFLRNGTVWVDFCCWPMYYKRSGTLAGYVQAPTLISEFFHALGRPLGAWPYTGDKKQVIFDVKNVFWRCLPRYAPLRCIDGQIPDTSYMWDWGMLVDEDITKYPEFRVDPDLRKASGTGEYTFPSLPDKPQPVKVYIYNHFAVRVQSGWYFWAYRRADGEGIAPERYAAFISSVLGSAVPPGPSPTPTPSPTPPPPPPPSPGCDPGQCTTRPILSRGNRGPCVGLAQQLLARAGFSPGPIDCIFGPMTESAVRSFQAARGLAVTGIVGPETWAALEAGAPAPPDKQRCLAAGGTWDDTRQVCVLPGKAVDWKVYAMYGGALLLVGAGVYLLVKGFAE